MNYVFQFKTKEGPGNYPPSEEGTGKNPALKNSSLWIYLGHAMDSWHLEGTLKGHQQTRLELKLIELTIWARCNTQCHTTPRFVISFGNQWLTHKAALLLSMCIGRDSLNWCRCIPYFMSQYRILLSLYTAASTCQNAFASRKQHSLNSPSCTAGSVFAPLDLSHGYLHVLQVTMTGILPLPGPLSL